MGRPRKCRKIGCKPDTTFFKPAGTPLKGLEEVQLTLDELEALRLVDLRSVSQGEAAEQMEVSQPTLSRMLSSARGKVADGLVHGKAIRVEGGNYEMHERQFVCAVCGFKWSVPFGVQRPTVCPRCESPDIHRASGGHRGGMR